MIEDKKIKDIIYLDDCRESMVSGFRGDNNYNTIPTGFSVFNKHYKWLKKDITVFAGMGNHGKSTLYMQLAILMAKHHGTKFGIFSPEQDPPDYFYDDIIHSYIGTYPNKKYLNEDVYFRAMEWVNKHFFYVFPHDEDPTPDYINDRFEKLILDNGVDGVCVDPFDQLDNDWASTFGRDDRYVSILLKKCKRFAIKHDIYYAIITHTNNTVRTNDEGDFNTPHVANLAGGAKWNNNTDNLIIVHRPYSESNFEDNSTLVKFAKIKKQKIVGVRGEVMLNFERNRNRYTDDYGSPFDESYGKVGQPEMFTEPNKDEDATPF